MPKKSLLPLPSIGSLSVEMLKTWSLDDPPDFEPRAVSGAVQAVSCVSAGAS